MLIQNSGRENRHAFFIYPACFINFNSNINLSMFRKFLQLRNALEIVLFFLTNQWLCFISL